MEVAQEEAPESIEELERDREAEALKPVEPSNQPRGRIPGAVYSGEKGPLDPQRAKDFQWYITVKLPEDAKFYRVWGGAADIKGRGNGTYYSFFPREGSEDFWRNQTALLPKWNSMKNTTEVTIPKGTTVYIGPAAPVVLRSLTLGVSTSC